MDVSWWRCKPVTYERLEFDVELDEYDESDPMHHCVGDMWMEVFEIMEEA